MTQRERRPRGYTVVELLMALAILAIGITGVIAMQKITVAANRQARELALATRIAQAWQEQLAVDAELWNHPSPNNPSSDLADTVWLKVVTNTPNTWFRPNFDTTRDFGPGFDALGNVVPAANLDGAYFCTHIRLNYLYPETGGNGLIRAEVRVFWLRENGDDPGAGTDQPTCSSANLPVSIGDAIARYHFVYATTAIRQNTAL